MDEIIKYYNYTNIQPLYKIENIKKSNKINKQASFIFDNHEVSLEEG
jgi:hypothetical protein